MNQGDARQTGAMLGAIDEMLDGKRSKADEERRFDRRASFFWHVCAFLALLPRSLRTLWYVTGARA